MASGPWIGILQTSTVEAPARLPLALLFGGAVIWEESKGNDGLSSGGCPVNVVQAELDTNARRIVWLKHSIYGKCHARGRPVGVH